MSLTCDEKGQIAGGRVDLRGIVQTKFGLSPYSLVIITIFNDLTGLGMIVFLLPFYVETFQSGCIMKNWV